MSSGALLSVPGVYCNGSFLSRVYKDSSTTNGQGCEQQLLSQIAYEAPFSLFCFNTEIFYAAPFFFINIIKIAAH